MLISRFKKYKYHNTLATMPLIQWGKLNESIQEGNPRFEYILKLDRTLTLPKINRRLKRKLEGVYNKMFLEIKNIDNTLRAYFHEFMYETNKTLLQINRKLLNDIEGGKKIFVNYDKCNLAFNRYLKHLTSNYNAFKISKYALRDDYLKIYVKEYGKKPTALIKELLDCAPEFITYYQYFEKSIEISPTEAFIKFTNNVDFINNIYEIKPHEIQDLHWYNELIKKQFIKYKSYDKYIMERTQFFNLNVIDCIPNEKYDFYKEINSYINYKNTNIDEFTTSVEKFAGLIDLAYKENIKENKPKSTSIKQFSEHA